MPYKIEGDTVVKKNSGKVVGHSSNPKKYMRVLQAVEHGWKPTGRGSKIRNAMHKQGKGGVWDG